MLKYENVIEKLTPEQKIALLTDTKEGFGEAPEGVEIPTVEMNTLWAENKMGEDEPLFPSVNSLANSWDDKLFGNVARCLASLGAKNGDNLFVLPSANAGTSVYSKDLSEEPYLSGALVAGIAKKFKETGISYCLEEPLYTKDDVRFLDKEADPAIVYDRVFRPYKMVEHVGGASAILLKNERAEGSYEEANKLLFEDHVSKEIDRIVKVDDADSTASSLTAGCQIVGGSALVLQTALENYKRIYHSMEEGGATAHELSMTLVDGAAISPEIIDSSLDKKLELAHKCSREIPELTEIELNEAAADAARKSIVLVKNQGDLLPFRGNESVFVAGDIIFDSDYTSYRGFDEKITGYFKAAGLNLVGIERGYSLERMVSPELIEPACEMAAKAGVTVAFVGIGAKKEAELDKKPRLSLPGNQVAMLSRLRRVSKKLVVVICGDRLPDMGFEHLADAILLAPSQGAMVAKAVTDVLRGKYNPSGRLAYASYSNVDNASKERQKRKLLDKQKIGPFVCYRYADSNRERSKYPIGFGLSYTEFEYTRLHVERSGTVSFTVRNVGRADGYETAQIYVGMSSSNRIRPYKELKGFVKIYLKAGERKTVNLSLGELDIYDAERGKLVIEAGGYDVHVASSSNDVHMTKRISLIGATLKKEDKKLSDYLQNVTNIVSEGYTMEAYCKPMNTKSKFKSLGFILLLATLFADVVYIITGMMIGMPIFKDVLYIAIFAGTNAFLLIAAAISLALGSAQTKKIKEIIAAQEKAATEELFKDVLTVDVNAIDELFDDEFDISLEATGGKKLVELDDRDDSTYTYMAVDTDIPTLCQELEAHFAESGLVITPRMARKLISSIMTSRLLVVRNAYGISGEKIAGILGRFFGTAAHAENIMGVSFENRSLLRSGVSAFDGTSRPAPLMQAITAAKGENNKACFYAMDNVSYASLGDILMPYVQYFGNPEIEHSILDEGGNVAMPSNLWFVIAPMADESLDDIPAFVANLAALVDLEAEATEVSAERMARKPVTCHQMEALIFRARKNAQIDEDIWKGIDSLEEFVSDKTPYHIGNKLFLQLEKYLAVYNTCEEDFKEAMDCAVATKLIPGILSMLKGNEAMAEYDLAQVTESIFGEEYATNCRNVIKRLVIEKTAMNNAKEETVNLSLADASTEDDVAAAMASPAADEQMAGASAAAPVGEVFETPADEPEATSSVTFETPADEEAEAPAYVAPEAPFEPEAPAQAEPAHEAAPAQNADTHKSQAAAAFDAWLNSQIAPGNDK